MLAVAIDIAFTTVLVFLFGTVAWVRRPDGRSLCWFAGWLLVLVSYLSYLGTSLTDGWLKLPLSAFAADLMAAAGVFFVVSSIIRSRGQRFGAFLWLTVAMPTVACLTLASVAPYPRWILCAAIAGRQTLAIVSSSSMRRIRPKFAAVLLILCATNGVLMLAVILHGEPQLTISLMLGEVFSIAGIDIWNRRTGNTIGMRVASIGLLAWAALFPLTAILQNIWPQIATSSEIWNPAKVCTALGMMLMMYEEEVKSARALAKDYGLIFSSNPNPLWIVDVETLQFLEVNEAACALHGYSRKEFLQLRIPEILYPDIREEAIQEVRIARPLSNRAARHLRKDGTVFPVDITAHCVEFQGRACRFVLCQDVTKRDVLEQKLEYQLDHDALTGLANRRSFEQRLNDAVARTKKTGKKLAVLCIDICRFKRLNDVYGPQIGDLCVQYVASVINARIRAIDFVARTGDDEFAVVMTGLRDLTPAEELTADLNEHFKEPVPIGEYEVKLAFSLGLAVCPDDSGDALSLWHLAENVLRQAQAAGNGQTLWLSPELRAEAEMRMDIASNMKKLIDEGRFHLAYQPLYGSDGKVYALEALLRLNHPRYGAVAPPIVIQTAEETGLIEMLGGWIFERTCRQLRSWMDEGVRLVPVAINISPMQLMRKGFAERLAETLQRFSVNPQWIHLEITETAAMSNVKAVSSEMSILSALGSEFSIDDFGTGHSSLARLHQLPLSILKIDRSFIVDLFNCCPDSNDTSSTIVKAILSMAHAMSLQVVAEGVETEQQLKCLLHMGCDLYQGYLLSKPVMPEEIPALIAQAHGVFSSSRVNEPCRKRLEQERENAGALKEAGHASP